MRIEDMSPVYKTLHYGIGDWAEPEEQKKGIHDVRRFKSYPAYPWKFDKEADHTKDNPKFFYDMCEQAGITKHTRAEEERQDTPISYSQWVERHKDEPGWVNHIATYGGKLHG